MMARDDFEKRTRQKLHRDLGPVIATALADPESVEIMLNPDGQLWLERLGEPMRRIGTMPPHVGEAVIRTLASHLDQAVSRDAPLLEGELPPDGARFAGQLPPVVQAPAFAIRIPAMRALRLADYEAQGSLSARHRAAIEQAIDQRRNILVVGGTGSGKTTFVNALIAAVVEAAPDDRVVIIEDTREIQCAAPNRVQLRTSRRVGMTELLRATLRMRPDRILVGEVRGPEALDLLMAWNTGHEGGAATIHANDAVAGLMRLEMLVSMHGSAPARPAALIAEAVDVVVHVARTTRGRRIRQVLEVLGARNGQYETREL